MYSAMPSELSLVMAFFSNVNPSLSTHLLSEWVSEWVSEWTTDSSLLLFTMAFSFTALILLLILPLLANVSAFGDPDASMTLHASDGSTRTNFLAKDHSCTTFPTDFHAVKIENSGSLHCALWTSPHCQGRLYIAPAHYTIDMPPVNIESVVC
ncbi:hypothetical protein BDF14DRAFT_1752794 [Spinellus fusiger]|nr:hypothetical protein BDF14DRAFT_1752794 [Spinellus fusiger]